MNVLLLTVSTGGGHQKAAEAVKEIVDECYPNSKTLIIDALRYASPIAGKIIVGSYLNTIRITPHIYRKLYQMSEMGDNFYDLSNKVNGFLCKGLESLISDFKPSIIVTTHPLSLQMLSGLKRKGKLNVPVLAIITDFAFHSFWLHDNIDAYIVAHCHLKREMVKWGIAEHKIYPYGIPVSQKFLYKRERLEVLKELGLDDKTTALIMGGSLGIGDIYGTFVSLMECRRDLQVIVVTGENRELQQKLHSCSVSAGKKAKILGYTDMIADLMDASDFILTKPGGLTITEALVKEKPIFIISPIPGTEEVNANFLVNNGAAVRVMRSSCIESVMDQIIDNPLRIEQMKEMAKHLVRKDSRKNTALLISKLESEARFNYRDADLIQPGYSFGEKLHLNIFSSLKKKFWMKV